MHFRRIKDLREDQDLTQAEVADIIHCSRGTYRTYESGLRTIPTDCLLLLCAYYGVSTDYLLGISDRK